MTNPSILPMNEEEDELIQGRRVEARAEEEEPLLHHKAAKWHRGPDAPNAFILWTPPPLLSSCHIQFSLTSPFSQ